MIKKRKNSRLAIPFKKDGKVFILSLAVYQFQKKKLGVKNRVRELLIKNGKEKISKKMTPAIFEFLWDFFKSEPSMCSHLLTGDNIFCVFENNETKYIKINPSQTAPLQKREVEKKFYSTPSTFFWMLTSLKETSEIKIKGKTFGSSLVAIYN